MHQDKIDELEAERRRLVVQQDAEPARVDINGRIAAIDNRLAALINSQQQGNFPPPAFVVFSYSSR